MSKTQKTRPFHVRIADRDLTPEEMHDHRWGQECDLIPLKKLPQSADNHSHRCQWTFVYDGKNICGCPLCTDQLGRRADRRASRHNAKKETAQLAHEYNSAGDVNDESAVLVR